MLSSSCLRPILQDGFVCFGKAAQNTAVPRCRILVQPVIRSKRPNFCSTSPTRRFYATTISPGGVQDPRAYCRELVQKHDRDSYLTSLFFPRHLQDACFAVRAFYLDLAMIQDSVSSPLIGQMRMQFWKDAVKGISEGRPPRHPIALALFEASKVVNLTPYHLKRIIEARENELNSSAHLSMDSLLAHAESTSSTLNYILLTILNLSSDTLLHAASHVGISQTLAILLRALPYHASKGRMVIPASMTAQHHVNQEDVFRRGPEASGIEDAVYEFAVVANDHLITAREMFGQKEGSKMQVPKEAMPVFLGAVPVVNYLARLEAANFNAFEPRLQILGPRILSWVTPDGDIAYFNEVDANCQIIVADGREVPTSDFWSDG